MAADFEKFSVKKPREDKREYLGLKLGNQLKLLLVSDPETDISAASLSVHCGSLLDPVSLQGLAHYLEHMCFMGSEKYPSENEYTKFLSQNGGSSNAYTSDTNTNFYFDVAPDQLAASLDRFAQFFIAPLILESSSTRELEAVNSEYFKNVDNDDWRIHQISKTISDPDHDYSKFNIGNLETLRDVPCSQGINTREALLKFHDQWYSSNLMSLCVLGKESIDDLIKIVVPLFSSIKNKNVPPKIWTKNPYSEKSLTKKIFVVPIKDKRNMDIIFKYTDETKYYKEAPGHYLAHLIGHEGKGSLLSELKARGLCSSLSAYYDCVDGFGFFHISVDLTEDALNRLDEIPQLVFQYINLLKIEGPKEYVFEENKRLGFIKFNFMEKSNPMDYVLKLTSSMHYFPFEDILSANILLENYNPQLITEMLSYLTPENCSIAISSKSFEGQTDLKEKYYGTDYKIVEFSKEFLESLRNPAVNANLKFPEPNEFIPTDFEIVKSDSPATETPTVIRDSKILKAWHLKDETYLKPKVFYGIQIVNPIVFATPDNTNANGIFTILFRDFLTEFHYDAKLAGLSFDLFTTHSGMNLEFFGYNHKMHVFVERVFEKLVNYEICPKRFEILKEKYGRMLKNYKTRPLYTLTGYYLNLITSELSWSYEELMASLDNLTIESVNNLTKSFFSTFYVETFIHGNINKEGALQLCNLIDTKLIGHYKTIPLANHPHSQLREIALEPGSSYRFETAIDIQKPKVIHTYFQVSFDNLEETARLQLISQLIHESFFDILRTKEQLGYVVFSKIQSSCGVSGVAFIIQSEYSTSYLDGRIEAYIAWAEKYIEKMDDKEFEAEKNSLITKLLKKKKKLINLSVQYWSEITRHENFFKRSEAIADAVKKLNKTEILQFFKLHLSHESAQRKKLSVHIVKSNPEQNALTPTYSAENAVELLPNVQENPGKSSVLIEDYAEFKKRKPLYPIPQPKM